MSDEVEPQFNCDFVEDKIVCPYCGYEHTDDLHELAPDGDEGEVNCEDCNKMFWVNVSTSYYYTSICGGYDNDGNDLDCEYIDSPSEEHPDYQICKRCGRSKFKRFNK